ncbi:MULTISPECIES: hypothetical protein [Halorhodospira]|uniref:hypothetical protein n=1 Tax=Halorhodospira TaxID=85108 RepID=UPI001EE8DD9B|nr:MULTISPECIES: hypothetical protein [Halorhodospira]MCG5528045.1 hypothetical protein [Halorhodospira halophila]MCG5543083.1 hypothetical protein [Halorhodospira sp. 9628]
MTDKKKKNPLKNFGRFLTAAWDNPQEAKQRATERFKETTHRARDIVDGASEYAREQFNNQTSLIATDSVKKIRHSDNPLVRLETQNVPSHVRAALVSGLAATGVFANSDEISQFTRAYMDHDHAALQNLLRNVFDPDEAQAISLWMDTDPSSPIAGGWAHRVHHGHDLNAMMTLMDEHGHIGVIEWANHVWLRDFWTPHGVPYLPAGSGSVYDWLVERGVSPSTAMGLLTVNAAEVTSGLLALYSGRRLLRGIDKIRSARLYKKALDEIEALSEEGSEEAALRRIDETEAFSSTEPAPHLRLHLALFCLGKSQTTSAESATEWGVRAFSIAADLCRSSSHLPAEVPYHGGTQVSFQGIAATVMASACSAHIQSSQLRPSYISNRINFGIKRFLEISERQCRPKRLEVQGKPAWGYRPFSALTNQLLALELALAQGSLYSIDVNPLTIRRKLNELLHQLQTDSGPSASLAENIESNVLRLYPIRS